MKWEYTTQRFTYHDTEREDRMNALGEEGWELVGFTGIVNETNERMFEAVFKRPKQPPKATEPLIAFSET